MRWELGPSVSCVDMIGRDGWQPEFISRRVAMRPWSHGRIAQGWLSGDDQPGD